MRTFTALYIQMDIHSIFDITNSDEFDAMALKIFEFQFRNNTVYQDFCNYLGKRPGSVKSIIDIPFLPIEFFKTKKIVSTNQNPEITFSSSGTTGSLTSKHHVIDLELYRQSYLTGFKHFYNEMEDYCVLALLPSYLEREGSSLLVMVDDLIKKSKHPESGFYLDQLDTLKSKLQQLNADGSKILLIGVSFALLDFVEKHQLALNNAIIMETGGMKGRRKELIREELHDILSNGFGVQEIHSEYGMTELLSQAYSQRKGIFKTPPWMKILIRDTEDPLTLNEFEKTGGINIIDLANLYSCSFIATQDLGKAYTHDTFEVLGRFDHSDIRGCNLMVL